jgi:ABC-type nitrate/sulfonate/bicarbonate transport system ATPase subunit
VTSPFDLSGATGAAGAVGADGSGRALHLVGLGHTYRTASGATRALGPIDVEVAPGEFLALLGPSGCGKTTLLQILAGFLAPSEGAAHLGDVRIDRPGPERGVVFQQSTALLPWRSVRQNVELGPRVQGLDKRGRRARADVELQRVGLTDFADRPVYELSGGMQQRVQIARVLANDPEVLLMDEPFGALDAMTREHLQGEVRALWRATGRTMVLITHSVEEAVALGSRVAVMSPRPGRIVFDEPSPFASVDRPLTVMLDDPDFHEQCRKVRAAIEA